MSVSAESGILVAGPLSEDARSVLAEALAYDPAPLAEHMHVVRCDDPRKAYELTAVLFQLSALVPDGAVIGFFCDQLAGAEGARLFQGGRETERREVVWADVQGTDSLSWPIGSLAMSLGIRPEELTRVERPRRPPLAEALEGLFRGEEPESSELLHQALQLIGQLAIPPASAVLARYLQSEDWVARYHAAKSYCRVARGFGQDGLPRLEEVVQDEDEGVREAVLQALTELIPETKQGDSELLAQIGAAIERGLADEDEDVGAAAEEAAELRQRLIG